MQTISEATTSKFVQAGGIRLHYNEVGSGYPIVMLHGAGPGATAWSNFKDNVPAFADQYRLLMFDMPQYGKSDKVIIEGPRLTYTARVLRDAMDELGIDQAHCVGNSMGGQVAMKLAIDAPERVSKLVCIGSTPMGASIFCPMPLEGIKLISNYYKDGGPSLEKMRTLIKTLVYDSSFLTEETLRERYESSLDPDIIRIMSTQPPGREDLTGQFEKVTCPVLLCWGMDDRFGALDIGLFMLRRFARGSMHIFNKCGHWAQVEHADEFNRVVLDFLTNA